MSNILPDGNPIWSRAPSIQQYGGHPEKHDYLNMGVVNAKTDIAAAQFLRMTADQASVSRVCSLLKMRITPTATTITVDWCAPAWAQPGSYSGNPASGPTNQYPTVSHSGANLVIQLPATAADDYGVIRGVLAAICCVFEGASWNGTIVDGAITLTGWVTGKMIALEVY
jgi:hypothetical protein